MSINNFSRFHREKRRFLVHVTTDMDKKPIIFYVCCDSVATKSHSAFFNGTSFAFISFLPTLCACSLVPTLM